MIGFRVTFGIRVRVCVCVCVECRDLGFPVEVFWVCFFEVLGLVV